MRLHRNPAGQVEVPEYKKWAAFELGYAMMAATLGLSYQALKRQLGYNDWQMREAVRKWAEERTGGSTPGST
jgi:hypothetical protein